MSGRAARILLDKVEIFLRRVGAVHRLQNAGGAGLQRKMDMLDQFRQPGESLDQIVPEADRDAAR